MAEPVVPSRDRTFGPTVLSGLAGAALAAVAGTRAWAHASGDAGGIKLQATAKGSETAPLVAALALVALAAWGVLLVTRGRVRRVVAAVGLLACAGTVIAVLTGLGAAQDDAVAALGDKGATGDAVTASLTGWPFAAGVGGVLALFAFGVAVARSSRWPAMGSRYDAPAARAESPATDPATDEDMWRALDEGRDPTS